MAPAIAPASKLTTSGSSQCLLLKGLVNLHTISACVRPAAYGSACTHAGFRDLSLPWQAHALLTRVAVQGQSPYNTAWAGRVGPTPDSGPTQTRAFPLGPLFAGLPCLCAAAWTYGGEEATGAAEGPSSGQLAHCCGLDRLSSA